MLTKSQKTKQPTIGKHKNKRKSNLNLFSWGPIYGIVRVTCKTAPLAGNILKLFIIIIRRSIFDVCYNQWELHLHADCIPCDVLRSLLGWPWAKYNGVSGRSTDRLIIVESVKCRVVFFVCFLILNILRCYLFNNSLLMCVVYPVLNPSGVLNHVVTHDQVCGRF